MTQRQSKVRSLGSNNFAFSSLFSYHAYLMRMFTCMHFDSCPFISISYPYPGRYANPYPYDHQAVVAVWMQFCGQDPGTGRRVPQIWMSHDFLKLHRYNPVYNIFGVVNLCKRPKRFSWNGCHGCFSRSFSAMKY